MLKEKKGAEARDGASPRGEEVGKKKFYEICRRRALKELKEAMGFCASGIETVECKHLLIQVSDYALPCV